jgi:hypothetical protein
MTLSLKKQNKRNRTNENRSEIRFIFNLKWRRAEQRSGEEGCRKMILLIVRCQCTPAQCNVVYFITVKFSTIQCRRVQCCTVHRVLMSLSVLCRSCLRFLELCVVFCVVCCVTTQLNSTQLSSVVFECSCKAFILLPHI